MFASPLEFDVVLRAKMANVNLVIALGGTQGSSNYTLLRMQVARCARCGRHVVEIPRCQAQPWRHLHFPRDARLATAKRSLLLFIIVAVGCGHCCFSY